MTNPHDTDAGTLPDFDPAVLIDVDVRDDLRAGHEPLARVLMQANVLPDGGVLHVRAPFQPVPLFHVMAQRGFAHHCEAFAADDWSSWFWRSASPPVRTAVGTLPTTAAPSGVIDLRHLPPPEPLVAILAQITRSEAPFDVIVPFDGPILPTLLADQGWQLARIDEYPDGVQLRITRATTDR